MKVSSPHPSLQLGCSAAGLLLLLLHARRALFAPRRSFPYVGPNRRSWKCCAELCCCYLTFVEMDACLFSISLSREKKGRLEKPTGTVRGTPGRPPQDPHSFFLSRFSLSSISSTLPPLFLFQHLIHSQPLLPPLSHARAWLLMGVRPPEYPAFPSLTDTYPLGNASTLVPGGFSVNTSLFLVCAKSPLTSVSLFRSLK